MSLIDKILSRYGVSETKIKVFRNLYWAVLGKVVTLLGGLFVGILVARYLGPEQYGLMSYVISYVSLFQIIASFGMDNIEIREESKYPEEKNKIIGTAFILKIIFAIISIILVCLTSWLFESNSFTKWMIVLYSLSMIINSFSVIRNYFTSIVWNEYIVKTEIVRTLVGVAIKVILLLIEASLAWFILATLFDVVLIAGGYIISYQCKIGPFFSWRFDKEKAIFMIKESFPLLLSGAAIVVYNKIDQVMIGNMLDKASVGYYSVACRFVEICIFVPTILMQTITPILVNTYQQDKFKYNSQTKVYTCLIVWCSIIIACFICIIATPLINYTFGIQYMESIPVLQILVFKSVGVALMQTSGQMIIIENKQKYAVIRNGVACVVCVIGNLFLIPLLGIIGAAISGVFAFFVAGYISHILIPPFRCYLRLQTFSLFCGWKYLLRKL